MDWEETNALGQDALAITRRSQMSAVTVWGWQSWCSNHVGFKNPCVRLASNMCRLWDRLGIVEAHRVLRCPVTDPCLNYLSHMLDLTKHDSESEGLLLYSWSLWTQQSSLARFWLMRLADSYLGVWLLRSWRDMLKHSLSFWMSLEVTLQNFH